MLLSLGLGITTARAQPTTARSTSAPAGVPSATTAAAKTPTAAKPEWSELNLSQQLALQPLAPEWDALSAAHKRKWLAVVRNYAKMTPEDQTVLHSRMTGWTGLSPQQRIQARFNFFEVKQLPADQRKAKWEAYQALSSEEKRALADRATPRPKGATVPSRPVAAQKLFAPVPVPVPVLNTPHTPRIELPPPQRKAVVAAPATMPPAPAPATEPPTPAP